MFDGLAAFTLRRKHRVSAHTVAGPPGCRRASGGSFRPGPAPPRSSTYGRWAGAGLAAKAKSAKSRGLRGAQIGERPPFAQGVALDEDRQPDPVALGFRRDPVDLAPVIGRVVGVARVSRAGRHDFVPVDLVLEDVHPEALVDREGGARLAVGRACGVAGFQFGRAQIAFTSAAWAGAASARERARGRAARSAVILPRASRSSLDLRSYRILPCSASAAPCRAG